MTTMRVWAAVALAVALRLWAGSVWSADRVETNTAGSSVHALREGLFLRARGISPYGRGSLHQPPVVLWLLAWVPDALLPYLSVAADAASALLLAQVAEGCAWLFLFNPLAIASCLSGSPATWYAPFVLGAVVARMPALAGLSLALAITLQPVALLLLPVLTVSAGWRALAHCLLWSALSACLSTLCEASLDWVPEVLLFPFVSTDLTPNVGLYWYFFIELFPAFQSLYRVTWMVFICVPIPPLAVALRESPRVLWFASLMIVAVFCPHPSVLDVALAHSLVPALHAVSLLSMPVYALSTALLLVFWQMWVMAGSGNANFYYAATVVGAVSNLYMLLDAINSERVRLYKERHKLE